MVWALHWFILPRISENVFQICLLIKRSGCLLSRQQWLRVTSPGGWKKKVIKLLLGKYSVKLKL